MKKYSSRRAKRGKLAYRTPSGFRFQRCKEIAKQKSQNFLKTKSKPR